MFANSDKPISPGSISFQFFSRCSDGSKGEPIQYHEEDANGQCYVFRSTYGVECIVCANGESDAWEVMVDEACTVSPEEVHEAYGLYLMQAKSCFAPDNGEPWFVLLDNDPKGIGSIVSESTLKCTGDRLTTGHVFNSKAEALTHALEFIQENEVELIEGYEYQSNSTGTGIVSIDHNMTMRFLTPAKLDRLEIICELVQE